MRLRIDFDVDYNNGNVDNLVIASVRVEDQDEVLGCRAFVQKYGVSTWSMLVEEVINELKEVSDWSISAETETSCNHKQDEQRLYLKNNSL